MQTIYVYVTLFFVTIVVSFYQLERKFISDLKGDKPLSLRWIKFVLWCLSSRTSHDTSSEMRTELHFYLIRKIIETREVNFEKNFLLYFQKAKKNSLLKEILRRVGEHEMVKPHIEKLTSQFICRYDHNATLSNLRKVLVFPYFSELHVYTSVFQLLNEGRWEMMRKEKVT